MLIFSKNHLPPSYVTVKLKGGLGNQMFQYAAARSIAIKTGSKLYLDLAEIKKQNDRKLALNWFELKKYSYLIDSETLNFKATKFVSNALSGRKETIYEEAGFNYSPCFEEIKPPVILDGYFQSEKYFSEYFDQIRKDFEPCPSLTEKLKKLATELIPDRPCIALHVRRGDYTNPQNLEIHGVLDSKYYKKALNLIDEMSDIRPDICVFTDDIKWVEENLPLRNSTRVISRYTENMIEDFFLMSRCTHNIIANSSFSWWAAYINQSPQKIVVAPQEWVKSKSIDTSDLYPANYLKI